MSEKNTHVILEQYAIFDGKPDFIDSSLVMNVLNHNSLGGSKKDLETIRNDPKGYPCENPKRYRVTLRIDYEDVTPINIL